MYLTHIFPLHDTVVTFFCPFVISHHTSMDTIKPIIVTIHVIISHSSTQLGHLHYAYLTRFTACH